MWWFLYLHKTLIPRNVKLCFILVNFDIVNSLALKLNSWSNSLIKSFWNSWYTEMKIKDALLNDKKVKKYTRNSEYTVKTEKKTTNNWTKENLQTW